jgi:hypothetical protein
VTTPRATIDPAADPAIDSRVSRRQAPSSMEGRRRLVESLANPRDWPEAAAGLLAALGFRLVDGGSGTDSHLLVALRSRPSLRHFDPEALVYFRPVNGRGAATQLDRRCLSVASSQDLPALWGHVHVVDRIPVENRFLTFGGRLRIAAVDPSTTVVDLASPAPIVRWGGHSQATDVLAEAYGSFFGRLIVPVDFMPGAEARVDAEPPAVLYRAFLIDAADRRLRVRRRGGPRTELDAWVDGAWARARLDPGACARARVLLDELGLSEPGIA